MDSQKLRKQTLSLSDSTSQSEGTRKRKRETEDEESIPEDGESGDDVDLEVLVEEIITDKFGDKFVEITRQWLQEVTPPILQAAISEKLNQLIATQGFQKQDVTQFPPKKPVNAPPRRLM